jgi:hypothetical protein
LFGRRSPVAGDGSMTLPSQSVLMLLNVVPGSAISGAGSAFADPGTPKPVRVNALDCRGAAGLSQSTR